jgi:polar amino acid transport system permease protein
MIYKFDFSFLLQYWPDLLRGIWLTLRMTLLSILPGFAVGTLCALGRIYGPVNLARAIKTYVELIRNTPLIIQVFWLFFGLSALHFRISALTAAVVALVINVSAYTAEIMRAGFEAIPKGQLEAASCLAMSRRQMIWHIELPQAVERVYPALVSQFVLMMLATSIMSQISADELTGVADLIQSFTFRGFEAYIVVAVIYLVIVSLMRLVMLASAALLFPRLRALRSPL